MIEVRLLLEEWKKCPVEIGEIINEYCEGYVRLMRLDDDVRAYPLGTFGNKVIFSSSTEDGSLELLMMDFVTKVMEKIPLSMKIDLGDIMFVRMFLSHIMVKLESELINVMLGYRDDGSFVTEEQIIHSKKPRNGVCIPKNIDGGNMENMYFNPLGITHFDANVGVMMMSWTQNATLTFDFPVGFSKRQSQTDGFAKITDSFTGKSEVVLVFDDNKIVHKSSNEISIGFSINEEDNSANIIVVDESNVTYVFVKDRKCIHTEIIGGKGDWVISRIEHGICAIKNHTTSEQFVVDMTHKPTNLCV